jgi:hypothetical protein
MSQVIFLRRERSEVKKHHRRGNKARGFSVVGFHGHRM